MDPGVELVVIGAAAVAVIGQIVVVWTARRQRSGLASIDERLRGLTDATALLTDTTESAIRDLLQHVERSAQRVAPARRAAATRRVSGAARRGLPVRDIAAAQEMSEGEVRLRLKLSPQAERDAAGIRAAAGADR